MGLGVNTATSTMGLPEGCKASVFSYSLTLLQLHPIPVMRILFFFYFYENLYESILKLLPVCYCTSRKLVSVLSLHSSTPRQRLAGDLTDLAR